MSAGGCPLKKILEDRVADRAMRFAGMIVQQLVKNAGCQGYEVETTGDGCGPQLLQRFELSNIDAKPESKIIATRGNACRKNV